MTTAMNACVALRQRERGYPIDPTTQKAVNGATQQRNRYFLHEKYATPYWMNHCEHCKAKLGDFETLQESGTVYDLSAGLN
jgi:hypothetical protein